MDESGKKRVDIHQCIDSALTILNTQQQTSKTVKIQKNYAKLPYIECVPIQLNQAFFNLLENALESLQRNQPVLTNPVVSITTQYLESSNWIRIDIQDNGPGIPNELLPKIFNPFFTTKPVGSGPGLGLTISHQILVKQHQGQLECSSTDAQCTIFTVKLPVN
ncbi:MAG: HAMP domain-containing histidine kinase [Leptolyngbya sp. SIO3F4]|nr:HAMP domain-containing histidine kinase [Leptolyngbya sp. SIO3F4]